MNAGPLWRHQWVKQPQGLADAHLDERLCLTPRRARRRILIASAFLCRLRGTCALLDKCSNFSE